MTLRHPLPGHVVMAGAIVLSVGASAAGAQSPAAAPVQPPAPVAAAPQPAPAAAGCDTNCVRANNEVASQLCAPRIEAEAPTDYEWVSRPFAKIFQQAEAPEGSATLVRYRGDSIRFLSPQREWVRVTYECGFDAAKRSVAYVRVRLGRLDKAEAPQPQANRGRPEAPQSPPSPQAAQQPGNAAQGAQRRILPSEPSDIEIRQVNPRRKQAQQ